MFEEDIQFIRLCNEACLMASEADKIEAYRERYSSVLTPKEAIRLDLKIETYRLIAQSKIKEASLYL